MTPEQGCFTSSFPGRQADQDEEARLGASSPTVSPRDVSARAVTPQPFDQATSSLRATCSLMQPHVLLDGRQWGPGGISCCSDECTSRLGFRTMMSVVPG